MGIVGDLQHFVMTDKALHDILGVIGSMLVALASLSTLLTRQRNPTLSRWLADPKASPAKRATEVWFLGYGFFWILCFAGIIASQVYLQFTEVTFFVVCGGLMLPLLLQPVLAPSVTLDQGKPLLERHSFKANVWIAVFSIIGNYWYTHYFYNVLGASYTFRSWDVNGVPIPMFFATHFYFCFYHTLSNMALHKVRTTFSPGSQRLLFETCLVLVMSYVTAFMEAFTISGFQCYSFEDRYMAWVLGSAFYGIYFIVSFPMYMRLDEDDKRRHTCFDALIESLASGMAVLFLLDFVRVAMGKDMTLSLNRPCKLDASKTCHPFTGMRC
uniref:Cycloeucalenol cycloisomerase n=1 Tax=Hemiselmis tepida TaxID=464990 RepID=A0A7S0YWN1_9CRYP|mmetsp:Transcript_3243/g.8289  ORF Transcript_3243/g.8289 Transcript_3243/m.8289 type:complete len:327 (+) Transcript_3243:49-1029(+)